VSRELELAAVKRSWVADPHSTVAELEAAVEEVLTRPWVPDTRVDWTAFFMPEPLATIGRCR
jgi:hypothetical protein